MNINILLKYWDFVTLLIKYDSLITVVKQYQNSCWIINSLSKILFRYICKYRHWNSTKIQSIFILFSILKNIYYTQIINEVYSIDSQHIGRACIRMINRILSNYNCNRQIVLLIRNTLRAKLNQILCNPPCNLFPKIDFRKDWWKYLPSFIWVVPVIVLKRKSHQTKTKFPSSIFCFTFFKQINHSRFLLKFFWKFDFNRLQMLIKHFCRETKIHIIM